MSWIAVRFKIFILYLSAKDYFGHTSLKPFGALWGTPVRQYLNVTVCIFGWDKWEIQYQPGCLCSESTTDWTRRNELQNVQDRSSFHELVCSSFPKEMTFIGANPIWEANIFIFILSDWHCDRRDRDVEQNETQCSDNLILFIWHCCGCLLIE